MSTLSSANSSPNKTIIIIASSDIEAQLVNKLTDHYAIHGANSCDEAALLLAQHSNVCVLVEQNKLSDTVRQSLQQGTFNSIVLSANPSFTQGIELLQQGFKGYGNVHSHSERLVAAIQLVEAGDVWLGASIVEGLKETIRPTSTALINTLTPKELEVAKQVMKELNNKDIAQRLEITERTVKAHLSMIYEKLSVKNRTELIFHFKNAF